MKKKELYTLFLGAVALMLALAGVTYAWFSHSASMETLMSIQPPDKITIIPVSEQGVIELAEIDLDFDKLKENWQYDETDSNGYIHILRPICVKSTNKAHRLEIVHTTNLKNLSFKIYPAQKDLNNNNAVFDPNVTTIVGRYINYKNKDSSTQLAETEPLGNYKNGGVVEKHAYPLYWLQDEYSYYSEDENGNPNGNVTSYISNELDTASSEMKDFYYTYYYLEILWKETTKQTDLFYIMAHNVAQ